MLDGGRQSGYFIVVSGVGKTYILRYICIFEVAKMWLKPGLGFCIGQERAAFSLGAGSST